MIHNNDCWKNLKNAVRKFLKLKEVHVLLHCLLCNKKILAILLLLVNGNLLLNFYEEVNSFDNIFTSLLPFFWERANTRINSFSKRIYY